MKMLHKNILATSVAAGLLTALPSANAAVVVGGLTLDDFDTPDLTTFNATLDYNYTAICFDSSGTETGACGTDNGLKGPNQVIYDGAVDFASSFGVLTIDGTNMAIDYGNGLEGVNSTSYSLTAMFTGEGLFNSIGSNLNVTSQDLLTADLTDFGFAGDSSSFELLLAATFTTGDFATAGTLGGVHIFGASALGDWQSDWSATDVSVNTAVLNAVPVPAAAWLFGSGLLALAGAARRKSII